MRLNEQIVSCGLCGSPTRMTGTKRCDGCWELESRIKGDPALAAKILASHSGPKWSDLLGVAQTMAASGASAVHIVEMIRANVLPSDPQNGGKGCSATVSEPLITGEGIKGNG
jgi:hypothetical protein